MLKEEYEVLNRCASVLLPLNLYQYFEMDADGQFKFTEGASDVLDSVIGAIRGREADLYHVRDEITRRMKSIMFYLDEFSVFEYILVRTGGRFEKTDEPETDIANEVNRLVNDIRTLKDKSLVQTNVVMITSQLPIRFTKQKFFDMTAENFEIYTGLQRGAADDFYENLLSYAGIPCASTEKDLYPELTEAEKKLVAADYRNLSADEYEDLKDGYNEASDIIRATVDCYSQLIKVVNTLIVLNETSEYETPESKEIAGAMAKMYDKVTQALENDDPSIVGDDVPEAFSVLEGKLEKYVDEKNRLEGKYEKGGKNMENEASVKDINMFMMLSESPFAELLKDELSEDEKLRLEAADDGYIHSLASDWEEKFRIATAGESMTLIHARMAGALGQMLPIFDDINKFKTYMETTLLNTSDRAEREGSIRQIRNLFEA